MDKKISVIVPVYKVEEYLHSCIDSILAQTFPYFDLILIDDGSPDLCGAICDEYAAKDDRIIVIHQDNAGVSAARNAGIDWAMDNSASEWIVFVDSDDQIAPEFLALLYQNAIANNADMTITTGRCFQEESELSFERKSEYSIKKLNGKHPQIAYFNGNCEVSPYPWAKLCKKKLFKELRFPEGIAYKEDEALIGQLLFYCESIVVIYAGMYYYRVRTTSAAHEGFSMNRYGHIKGLEICEQFYRDRNEKRVVDAIIHRKKKYMAKYFLLARGAGFMDLIPAPYKMPVWKALFATIKDTIASGGIKLVIERIKNFIRLTK